MVLARGLTVYVDGVEIKHCTKFNIAEGWAECLVTSPSKYANQDAGPDDFLRSRLYGFIEVGEVIHGWT